jgi:hypothetical protein
MVSKDVGHLDPAVSRRVMGLPGELQLGLGRHMVNAKPQVTPRLTTTRSFRDKWIPGSIL